MSNWYISTTGTAGGTGAIDDPWDMATGFAKRATVQPGDTVYVRGGTYYYSNRSPDVKGYTITLVGTDGNPITIRPYEDEIPKIDGGIEGGRDVSNAPAYLVIRDLEVFVSELAAGNRHSALGVYDLPPDLLNPWGGINFNRGIGIKVVNNYVHDNMQGISFWSEVVGELYGNIVYHNGWTNTVAYGGHGIYSQNSTGQWKYYRNNIVMWNYNFNVQIYGGGSAVIDDIWYEDNIAAYGAPDRHHEGDYSRTARTLIGGLNDFSNNNLYVTKSTNWHSNLQLGYAGHGGTYLTNTFNYICLGYIQKEAFDPDVSHDNFVWRELYSGGWTGILSPSGPDDGAPIPSTPRISLEVNEYDSNRAHVTVFAANEEATADIDISGWLQLSEGYQVKDPTDFHGDSIVEGMVTSSTITVPLSRPFTVFVILRTVAEEEEGGPYQRVCGTVSITANPLIGQNVLEDMGLCSGTAPHLLSLISLAGSCTAQNADASFRNVPYYNEVLGSCSVHLEPFYQRVLGDVLLDAQTSETVLPTVLSTQVGDLWIEGIAGLSTSRRHRMPPGLLSHWG